MGSNQTSSFCMATETTKCKENLELNFENSSYNSTRKPNNPIQNWTEDLNQRFSKDDIQMANKHTNRWSTLEKCKLKLRGYHLTPVRMAIVKKSINNKCWTGCGEKGTLLYC